MSTEQQPELVWITGASSGLGRELAKMYAQQGATVIASARGLEQLKTLEAEVISNKGGDLPAPAGPDRGCIIPMPLDVTDNESVTSAVASILSGHGVPDVVILNAGYYEPCSLNEITLEHFEKTIDVNYRGVVRCLLAVLPQMIAEYATNHQCRGHIVLVSSVAGYSGLPQAAAYGSTKAALTHLAESIKHECNHNHLDVTVVNPGFVRTPLTDQNDFAMPFIMEVEDAARAMHKGIVAKRFEVTFPKRFTWILKFLRILPYPLYFFLTRGLLSSGPSPD